MRPASQPGGELSWSLMAFCTNQCVHFHSERAIWALQKCSDCCPEAIAAASFPLFEAVTCKPLFTVPSLKKAAFKHIKDIQIISPLVFSVTQKGEFLRESNFTPLPQPLQCQMGCCLMGHSSSTALSLALCFPSNLSENGTAKAHCSHTVD